MPLAPKPIKLKIKSDKQDEDVDVEGTSEIDVVSFEPTDTAKFFVVRSSSQMHTCQLFLFNRNCPYFDPRKGRKKSDFIMCSYFGKNLPVVIGNSGMFLFLKIFLPFVPIS